MTEYKISSTVPAPAGRTRKASAPKYPFEKMRVSKTKDGELLGDSFLIPGRKITEVSSDVYKHAKREGVSVALRSFPDGVRVYKIAEGVKGTAKGK